MATPENPSPDAHHEHADTPENPADETTPGSTTPGSPASSAADPGNGPVSNSVSGADDASSYVASDDLISEVNSALAGTAEEIANDPTTPKAWRKKPWDEADYEGSGNFNDSARKLADSAVAPLVAAARGYQTLLGGAEVTKTYAAAAKRYGLPTGNGGQAKRVKDSLNRGDVMLMPWYLPNDVRDWQRNESAGRSAALASASVQFRPKSPELDDSNKERKYEFIAGHPTVIGLHPSTPMSWLHGDEAVRAPVLLVAEGLLKGDSALTGYLLAQPHIGADDLTWEWAGDFEDGVRAARAKLADLLGRIAVKDRVAITTIGGVYNWRNNPEWNDLGLRGRTVWFGVDGDVSTNQHVHSASVQFFEFMQARHADVKMLAPSTPPEDGSKKVGIDDYLSHHGDWSDLLEMLADEVGPRPMGVPVEDIGKWRIDPDDKVTLQKCLEVLDPEGNRIGGKWDPVLELGGRIVSMVVKRGPTAPELRSGKLSEVANNIEGEWFVELEILWREGNGSAAESATIVAPSVILNYPPDQWARHGAEIPAMLLRSEHWPPPKAHADDWMRAVKANRKDEQRIHVSWGTMGWVPVKDGVPAFIIGNDVIGDEAGEVHPGVTDADLGMALRFGVGEIDGDFEIAHRTGTGGRGAQKGGLVRNEYAESVRESIVKLINTFILSEHWTDPEVAAAVLAMAMLPALPLRASTPAFIYGPPGRGKSFTASAIMSFWGATPTTWRDQLPGSAKDTATAIELAIARSPIWVIDDLAPSASRGASENEQTKIADVIRNSFNAASKGRSNADLKSRKGFTPQALVIVTAENELDVASAMARTVSLYIGYGSLGSQEASEQLRHLAYTEGVPAKVAQAMVKFIRAQARLHKDGWAGYHADLEARSQALTDQAADHMRAISKDGGNSHRHSAVAGRVALSLGVLADMAREVGVDGEMVDLFDFGEKCLMIRVFELMFRRHQRTVETAPGRALLKSVSSVLFAGQGHIANPYAAGQPPVDDKQVSSLLGWSFDEAGGARVAGGSSCPVIGELVHDAEHGDVVYLSLVEAFKVAQRHHPDLIQHGQKAASSWSAAVGEGLVFGDGSSPRGNSYRFRERTGGDNVRSVSGFPIRLDRLLAMRSES